MQKDAYQWYEQQSQGLGELFLKELDYCYRKIQAFPSANSIVKKDYRQMSLKRFPYVVVFKIKNADILIYAVFLKFDTLEVFHLLKHASILHC